MKKITVAILAIVLTAMGAIFVFAQQNAPPEGHRGFGKRGGHGSHGRMLRHLDLTEAQKAQVKQIMANSRITVEPLREQLRENRRQLSQLSADGSFDAAGVQAIAARQGNLTAQLIVEKERVKAQIFQILTPEQRRKAAEMRERMKQRFENKMENRRSQPAVSDQASF